MDMDLFYMFRRFLVIVCTVYTVIRLGQSVVGWAKLLSGSDKQKRVLRHYLQTHLWRIRMRKFWPQWLQIAALLAVLTTLLWLHRLV